MALGAPSVSMSQRRAYIPYITPFLVFVATTKAEHEFWRGKHRLSYNAGCVKYFFSTLLHASQRRAPFRFSLVFHALRAQRTMKRFWDELEFVTVDVLRFRAAGAVGEVV